MKVSKFKCQHSQFHYFFSLHFLSWTLHFELPVLNDKLYPQETYVEYLIQNFIHVSYVVGEMIYWDAVVWHHNYEFRDCAGRKERIKNMGMLKYFKFKYSLPYSFMTNNNKKISYTKGNT